MTALLKMAQYELPVQVDLVSNERLVIGKRRKRGSLETPMFMGETIARCQVQVAMFAMGCFLLIRTRCM